MNPSDYPLALWPPSASAMAGETDSLILSFTVLTLLLVVPIFLCITYFAIRYRDGQVVNRNYSETRDRTLEISWMVIPFVLTLFFFVWGAKMFSVHKHPPANAMQVEAIGRQWMWKFQHPGGQAEINNLHLPIGEPIIINMISQDVIHGLLVPALRLSMETLPGRYTQIWFKADRPGTYRLLCSEFCGTDHSVMDGLLTLMSPSDYQNWLNEQGAAHSVADEGRALFATYGCSGCHNAEGRHAPSLAGVYGQPVQLADGNTAVADASFIRRKIMEPDANRMSGYAQLMPSFKGRISEADMTPLLAYIKAYGPADGHQERTR